MSAREPNESCDIRVGMREGWVEERWRVVSEFAAEVGDEDTARWVLKANMDEITRHNQTQRSKRATRKSGSQALSPIVHWKKDIVVTGRTTASNYVQRVSDSCELPQL